MMSLLSQAVGGQQGFQGANVEASVGSAIASMRFAEAPIHTRGCWFG